MRTKTPRTARRQARPTSDALSKEAVVVHLNKEGEAASPVELHLTREQIEDLHRQLGAWLSSTAPASKET